MEAAAVHLNLKTVVGPSTSKCIIFTCARLFQRNSSCYNYHIFSMKHLECRFLRTCCAFLSAWCDPWRAICNPCLSTSPALLISVLKSSERTAGDILMQKHLQHPHGFNLPFQNGQNLHKTELITALSLELPSCTGRVHVVRFILDITPQVNLCFPLLFCVDCC